MSGFLPDYTRPEFQRLALLLARVGRNYSEIGLSDPDEITNRLIIRSLMAEPLLLADRPLLDLGGGAGIPALPLALSRPGRLIYLVEPRRRACSLARWLSTKFDLDNVIIIESKLSALDPAQYRGSQVVSRAALDISELLSYLPVDHFSPFVKWSGEQARDRIPESGNFVHVSLEVEHEQLIQRFCWLGEPEMFHVKQNQWKKMNNIRIISD